MFESDFFILFLVGYLSAYYTMEGFEVNFFGFYIYLGVYCGVFGRTFELFYFDRETELYLTYLEI